MSEAATIPQQSERQGPLFSRILVALDGRPEAGRALAVAVELARRYVAELALLTVVDVRQTYAAEAGIEPAELLGSLRREGRGILLSASLWLPAELHPTELLREGEPAHEIVEAARAWHADLIILGGGSETPWPRLRGAGVAETVLRHAPCPVLVARPQTPAAAPALMTGCGAATATLRESTADQPRRVPA